MHAMSGENRAASSEDVVKTQQIACGVALTWNLRRRHARGDRLVDGLVIWCSRRTREAGENAVAASHLLAVEEWQTHIFCAAMGSPMACGWWARRPLSGR